MCFRPRWNHWWYHQGRSSHASANTPLSRRYIIPLNQRKSFYLSFIFYNTESREDGAEAEAESLRSAFDDTGFTVVKDKWTHENRSTSGICRPFNFNASDSWTVQFPLRMHHVSWKIGTMVRKWKQQCVDKDHYLTLQTEHALTNTTGK